MCTISVKCNKVRCSIVLMGIVNQNQRGYILSPWKVRGGTSPKVVVVVAGLLSVVVSTAC